MSEAEAERPRWLDAPPADTRLERREAQPVREVLRRRGIGLRAVASGVGVSVGTVHGLVTGWRYPKPEVRAAFAAYLDVPEDELFRPLDHDEPTNDAQPRRTANDTAPGERPGAAENGEANGASRSYADDRPGSQPFRRRQSLREGRRVGGAEGVVDRA